MSRDALRAHLEFFTDLGIDGFRRELQWRTRAVPDPPRRRDAAAGVPVRTAAPPDVAAAPESRVAAAPDPHLAALPAVSARLSEGVAGADVPAAPDPLAIIKADLGPDCRRCKLHGLGRRQVVFGVGNPDADLMFVGEAPGADEDIQGEPFVGRAGQLLTKIIEAIQLRRQDVYIANVIKCRPPGNRNPEPDEVEQCEPFLFRQIDAIRPKVIVALGKFAAQSLLRSSEPITRLRGREFRYREAILIPTYHPAYLLRNPEAKREVWEDMKRVRVLLGADREGG